MSRLFDASGKYLEATTGLSAPPSSGSFCYWINPQFQWDAETANRAAFCIWYDNTHHLCSLPCWGSNDLSYHGVYNGTNYRIQAYDNEYFLIPYRWNLIVLTWAAGGSSYLYINNQLIKSGSISSVFTSTPNAYWVSRHNDASYNMNAYFAHWALWNIVIDSDDRADLWARISPQSVQYSNLQFHYPIDGSSPEADLMGGPDLTVIGSISTGGDPLDTDNELRVSQFAVQAVVGKSVPDISVDQFIAEVIEGQTTPDISVDQFVAEVIHSVTGGGEVTGSGGVWVGGTAAVEAGHEEAEPEYVGSGGVWVGGTAAVEAFVHGHIYEPSGGVWVGGAAAVENYTGPCRITVSQVVTETLATGPIEINVYQIAAELLAEGIPPVYVYQAVLEPLATATPQVDVTQVAFEILAPWQRGDFMPMLQRLIAM